MIAEFLINFSDYFLFLPCIVYATFDNKAKFATAGVNAIAPTFNQNSLQESINMLSKDKLVVTLGSWATGSFVKSITPSHVRRLLEAEGVLLGKKTIIHFEEPITKAGDFNVFVDGISMPLKVLPVPQV